MNEIIIEDLNEYTIKIDNNEFLKSDIESTYRDFIALKKNWEDLNFQDKLKLIAYYFIIKQKRKKVSIKADKLEKNPFKIVSKEEQEINIIKEKQKIIEDIIKKIDRNIHELNSLYTKQIKEFAEYLNKYELDELKTMRQKLFSHFGA